MMELLFRGKRKDNGQWHIGRNLIQLDPHLEDGSRGPTEIFIIPAGAYCVRGNYPFSTTLEWSNEVFVPVDSETIGRFTGRVDKKGNKIFEGDIVKDTRDDELNVVKWENDGFILMDDCDCVLFFNDDLCSCLEIVGNIHDNSELFEVKDE